MLNIKRTQDNYYKLSKTVEKSEESLKKKIEKYSKTESAQNKEEFERSVLNLTKLKQERDESLESYKSFVVN